LEKSRRDGAFFGHWLVAGGKKRGFCRLPWRVATPGTALFSDIGLLPAAKSVVFAACLGA
jgi:hypothetical protein